ncbi:MAG TPA: DUF4407 domain-containing protein [Puia sp.]|nr:DUF4407 domain-containing protein [Puia sp.]
MPEISIRKPIIVLCRLSGEDAAIIFDETVEAGVAVKFAFIGLLVLVILILSVYSSVHFLVDLLNGNHIAALLIGTFWGAMIANIYYLLLFTITPPLLRGREHVMHGAPAEVTTEKKLLSGVSLGFRLLFVILLAIIVAQPWLVTIFDTSRWIDQERRAYRKEFVALTGNGGYSSALPIVANQRKDARHRIDRLLSVNNFYTEKIRLIQRHYPLSWLVTMLVVLLFVAPIGLKYQIRNKSGFYAVKKEFEEHFVRKAYAQFKEWYATIFAEQFGVATAWYESCIDPPFNTRKKEVQQEFADQQELLDAIYRDEEDAEMQKYFVSEMRS